MEESSVVWSNNLCWNVTAAPLWHCKSRSLSGFLHSGQQQLNCTKPISKMSCHFAQRIVCLSVCVSVKTSNARVCLSAGLCPLAGASELVLSGCQSLQAASSKGLLQAALGRGLVGVGPHPRGAQPCDRAVAVQGPFCQSGHLPWAYCEAVPSQHYRYGLRI